MSATVAVADPYVDVACRGAALRSAMFNDPAGSHRRGDDVDHEQQRQQLGHCCRRTSDREGDNLFTGIIGITAFANW